MKSSFIKLERVVKSFKLQQKLTQLVLIVLIGFHKIGLDLKYEILFFFQTGEGSKEL